MTNIEYDLKEILTRLEGRFDKLEGKIDNIGEDITDFQVEVGVLSQKVEGITKRLDNHLLELLINKLSAIALLQK